MSNPAVLILDSLNNKKGRFKRFQLEDNIGESIHLHIDNMRIDFTINEFFNFSDIIRKSLEEVKFLFNFSIDDFDAHFLKEIACFLPFLKEIKIEEIKLSELKCIVHSNYRKDLNFVSIKNINDTPAYQYLKGDKKVFLSYEQYNYFNISNEIRLMNNFQSIVKHQYPFKNNYIILFNGQNLIRDGQHRAAILAHLNGYDQVIKVMRFYFTNNSHFVNSRLSNVLILVKWFIKFIYKKFVKVVRASFKI
jgi:hypothetical protein